MESFLRILRLIRFLARRIKFPSPGHLIRESLPMADHVITQVTMATIFTDEHQFACDYNKSQSLDEWKVSNGCQPLATFLVHAPSKLSMFKCEPR